MTNKSPGNVDGTTASDWSTTLIGLQGNVQERATFFPNNKAPRVVVPRVPTLSETKVDANIKGIRGSDLSGIIQLQDSQVDTVGTTQITGKTSTIHTDSTFTDKSSSGTGFIPIGGVDIQTQVVSVRRPFTATPETATLTVDISRSQTDTSSRLSSEQTTRQFGTGDLTNDLSMEVLIGHKRNSSREISGIPTSLKISKLLPAAKQSLIGIDSKTSSITKSLIKADIALDNPVKSSSIILNSKSVSALPFVNQNELHSSGKVERSYVNATLNLPNVSNDTVQAKQDFIMVHSVDANVGNESTSTTMGMTLDGTILKKDSLNTNTGLNALSLTDPVTLVDSGTVLNNTVVGGQPYAELSINGRNASNNSNNEEINPIDLILAPDRIMATSSENPSTATYVNMSINRKDISADLRPQSHMKSMLDGNPGTYFSPNVKNSIQTLPDVSSQGNVIRATNIQNMESISEVDVVGVKIETAPVVKLSENVIIASNAPNNMHSIQDINLTGGVTDKGNSLNNVETSPDLNLVDPAIVSKYIPNYIATLTHVNAVGSPTNMPTTMETVPEINPVRFKIGPKNIANNLETFPVVDLLVDKGSQIITPQSFEAIPDVSLVKDGIQPITLPNRNEIISDAIQVGAISSPTKLQSNTRTDATVGITDFTDTSNNIRLPIENTSMVNVGQQANGIFIDPSEKIESSLTDFGLQGEFEPRPTGLTDSSVKNSLVSKSGLLRHDNLVLADGSLTKQTPYVDHSLGIKAGPVQSITSQTDKQTLLGLDTNAPVVKTAAQTDQVSVVIPDILRHVQTMTDAKLDNTVISKENLVQTLSTNKFSGIPMSIPRSTNIQDIYPYLSSLNSTVISNLVNSVLGNHKESPLQPTILENLSQNSQLNTVSLGSLSTSFLDKNKAMVAVNKAIANPQENPSEDAPISIQNRIFENLNIHNNLSSEPSADLSNKLQRSPALSNMKIQPELEETNASGSLDSNFHTDQQNIGNVVKKNIIISNAANDSIQSIGQPKSSSAFQDLPIETSINPNDVDLRKKSSVVTSRIYTGDQPNIHSDTPQPPLEQGSNIVVTGSRKDTFNSGFDVFGSPTINNNLTSGPDKVEKGIPSIAPDSINLINEMQRDIISGPILLETEPSISAINEQSATGPIPVVESINRSVHSNMKTVSVNDGVWSAPGINQQNQIKNTVPVNSKDTSTIEGLSLSVNFKASGSSLSTNPKISVGSRNLNHPVSDINLVTTESLTSISNLEPVTVNVAGTGANNNVASDVVELPSKLDIFSESVTSGLESSGAPTESIESRVVKLEPVNNVKTKNTDSPILSDFPKKNAAIAQNTKLQGAITTEVTTKSISGQGSGPPESSVSINRDVPSVSVTFGAQSSNTVDYVVASGSHTTTDITTFMKDVKTPKELQNKKILSKSNVRSTKRATTDQTVDIKSELNNFNMNDIPPDTALAGNIQVSGDGVLTPRFGQRNDRTTRFRNLNRLPDTANARSRRTRTRETSLMPTDERVIIDPRTGLESRVRGPIRDSFSRSRRPEISVSRDNLADFGPPSSGGRSRFTSFAGDNSVSRRGGRSFERSRPFSITPDRVFRTGGRTPSSVAGRSDSSRDASTLRFISSGPRRVTGRRVRGSGDLLSSDFVRDVRPFDPTPFDPNFDPLTPFDSERTDRSPFRFVRGADGFLQGPQLRSDLIPRAFERLPPSRFDDRRVRFGIRGEFPLFDGGGFRGFPLGSSPILSSPIGSGLFDPFMGGTLTATGFSGF